MIEASDRRSPQLQGANPCRNTMSKQSAYQTYRNVLASMSHLDLIDYTAGILVQLQKHNVLPSKENPKKLDFSKVKK